MKLWLRTNGWDRLARELDLWGAARAVASFWWRDDDAVQPTPQLDELLGRAGRVPLALSVIPAKATEALAGRLRGEATVCVLQHGWRHESHVERRVDEYPAHRPAAEVAAELSAGRRRLGSLFGEQSIPVFVPPAHAFHTGFLPLLRRSGLAAISRKGARPSRLAAEGLVQANVHVAPIRWGDPASFDDDRYLGQFIDHLRRRRRGRCDAEEPTGLLTHHLDQRSQSFEFISRLAALVSDHPSACWVDPRGVFGAPALAGLDAAR